MDDQDRLDRLEKKIDKVLDHVANHDVTAARQQVSLDEHIRRTNILEHKFEPVQKHVAMVNGALKVISALGISALIRYLWVK